MTRRPTIVLLALLGIDYTLWLWAIGRGDGGASLFFGLLLVPLAIGVAWRLVRSALGALARAPRRRAARPAARNGRTGAANGLSSDAAAPTRAGQNGETATMPPSRIAA